MSTPMLDHLKANNRAWAARKVAADSGFFKRLVNQQAPEYLWIGWSDSRGPAHENVDRDPRALIVPSAHSSPHRTGAQHSYFSLPLPNSPCHVLEGQAHHRGRALRLRRS